MTIYREMTTNEYTPPDEAAELWNRILDQDKLSDFESYIESVYANGLISEMELDDLLRYESEEIEELLDLEDEDDDEEDDEEEEGDDFDI